MALLEVEVTSVTHHTDTLFKIQTTRPASFRFRTGEFVMIGLPGVTLPNKKAPLLRAYSIASPVWADCLEFYSIKVHDGPLTSRLQHVTAGDTMLIGDKATGTLVYDALTPARVLWLLSTGTGIAPFASVVRDPEAFEKFDQINLVHGTRYMKEHMYAEQLYTNVCQLDQEMPGAFDRDRLRLIKTTTREQDYTTTYQKRITDHLEDGTLFWFGNGGEDQLQFDSETDRVMICGSTAMNRDLKALCLKHGLQEGSLSRPGEFVIEKAFVG